MTLGLTVGHDGEFTFESLSCKVELEAMPTSGSDAYSTAVLVTRHLPLPHPSWLLRKARVQPTVGALSRITSGYAGIGKAQLASVPSSMSGKTYDAATISSSSILYASHAMMELGIRFNLRTNPIRLVGRPVDPRVRGRRTASGKYRAQKAHNTA